jgi:hypothetical protein
MNSCLRGWACRGEERAKCSNLTTLSASRKTGNVTKMDYFLCDISHGAAVAAQAAG